MPLPENWYTLAGTISDVSETNSVIFRVPTAGILRRVECQIGAAITVADAVLTVSKNGSALTPTITIATSGSAIGTNDEADYYVQVAKGDAIKIASDGGSTTASAAAINCIFSG